MEDRHLDTPSRTARGWKTVQERVQKWTTAFLAATNRIRMPSVSVLPVAGAVVGLYGGLAAGIFANLIGLVAGIFFGLPRMWEVVTPGSPLRAALASGFARAPWHTEYAIVAAPLAIGALLLARVIAPGGPRDVVKRRLRVLALLVLGGLGLDYPLVALSVLNSVFGQTHDLVSALRLLPKWAYVVLPAVGGAVVGRLLYRRPELHGHGVPEVVATIRQEGALTARDGLLKLIASAVTIGSGGSAGREGPIVYGGAAFGSSVGRTLGFSRRELAILLASGAGAGIAASFDAPIGGAIFAMEIILREFELRALSPIVLASVTATLVSHNIVGAVFSLGRLSYELTSGFEVLCYVGLGVLCGGLAYAFIWLLHEVEALFRGRGRAVKLSSWLSAQPLWTRAALGGLGAGLLALVNPTVWGTGHEFSVQAAQGSLAFGFLALGCVLKLVATPLTIGSGGSGGTFYPATVIGAMGGGAFGVLVHSLFPGLTAPSGAYATVGMAGVVAGLTRGPLTGMMMIYEISQDSALILPLMVTCSIASALTHAWVERRAPKVLTTRELLRLTPVRAVMEEVKAVPADTRIRPLLDAVRAAEAGAVAVVNRRGEVDGLIQAEDVRHVFGDEQLGAMLTASDVARRAPVLGVEVNLAAALDAMDAADTDAALALDAGGQRTRLGLVTRTSIRRYLAHEAQLRREAVAAVAATEIDNTGF